MRFPPTRCEQTHPHSHLHSHPHPTPKEAPERLQPADGLSVARGDAVPRAPHILPCHVADAVEPRVLDRVAAALVPPAADGRHPPPLQPLEDRHARRDLIKVGPTLLAPAESRPSQRLPAGAKLRLHRRGPALRYGGQVEPLGDVAHRIAVETVRVRLAYQLRERLLVGDSRSTRRIVPWVVRPEHRHVALVQAADEGADSTHTSGEQPHQIELVAVVEAQVGVGGP